jgi:hypothetical protein
MVKIKIEFIVLNALVKYSKRTQKHGNMLMTDMHKFAEVSSETVQPGVP